MSKINWALALQDYVMDETMSYAKIAEKHGVSTTAVEERGAEENWPQIREDTLAKVRQNLPEKIGENLLEISKQHNQLAKLLIQQALKAIEEKNKDGTQKIKPRSFRDVREAIVDGVKIQRQTLGMDEKEKQNINIMNHVEILPSSWYVSNTENSNQSR